MSIVEPDRSSAKRFLSVVCPCGRGLRAPIEMAGHEISCWECHRMVLVPIPRSRERAYRVITDGIREIYDARWFFAVLLFAALLTGVLCLKGVGIPLGVLVLFIGLLGYGELIRQCGIDVWDFDDWKEPVNLVLRVGIALAFALSLAAPLLLSPGGLGAPPRFSTLGVILGLIGAFVLPLATFLVYARDEVGPLGWRRGSHVILSYPFATILALMLIPIGIVAAELTVIVMTSWQGMFPFLILDLYPGSEYFAEQYKIPKFGNYTKSVLPDGRFFNLYFRRLHQGFTYVAILPASLSRRTNVMASPWTLDLDDADYLKYRAIYTQVSTMVLVAFLTLQSRWLGAISTLESKRSLEG